MVPSLLFPGRRRIRAAILPVALLGLSATSLFTSRLEAQAGSAAPSCTGERHSIIGKVVDDSKASIPLASVRASCGGKTEETTTGDDGSYRLVLAPGTYQVRVTAPGFSETTASVTITASTKDAPEVAMNIAKVNTAVTVTAEAGLVATTAESASKIDTPILEQPFSIETVTHTQLLQQNVQTLTQALRYSAGVSPDTYGSDPRGDWFLIRGNQADVYVDGLRLPQIANSPNSFAALQVDPNDLQHLEILLGPSSTLYGQSNLGGIVDAVSKKPSLLPHRSIELQGGNFDRVQGGADMSGPLNRNASLLYSINGIARTSHTYVYGAKDDRFTLNPTLEWRPTLNLSIDAFGKFFHTDMGTGAVFLPRLGTLDRASYGYLPTSFNDGDPVSDKYRKRQYMLGYNLDYRAATWNLRNTVRYVHMNVAYKGLYMGAVSSDGLNITRINFNFVPVLDGLQTDTHAMTHRRTGKLQHTLVGGFDFQWQKYKNRQGTAIDPVLFNVLKPVYGRFPTPPPITTQVDQTQFQGGAYGQEQVQVAGFTFVAGGRYDQTAQESFNLLTGTSTPQHPHAFTGRGGVSYRFGGLAPYASYSTSFLPTVGLDFYGNTFKPTRGSSYEGGLKYQLPHHIAMVSASAFSMTQANRTTADPEHPLFSIQRGEVRTTGFELQGNGTVLHSLDIALAYAHIRPRVTRSNGVDYHKELQPNAKDSASLWMHYTTRRTIFAGLGFGGGTRYIGPKWGDAANTFQTPGYTLFDGALDYTMERWRFSVNSNNLLNKRFISSCSATTTCYYGATRSAIGSVSFSF